MGEDLMIFITKQITGSELPHFTGIDVPTH